MACRSISTDAWSETIGQVVRTVIKDGSTLPIDEIDFRLQPYAPASLKARANEVKCRSESTWLNEDLVRGDDEWKLLSEATKETSIDQDSPPYEEAGVLESVNAGDADDDSAQTATEVVASERSISKKDK